MSVSSISQGYSTNIYRMQQQMLAAQGGAEAGSGASGTSATSTAASAGYQGKSTVASLVELTQFAMDAMGVGKNERTSFSQISNYKKQLEKEYSQALQSALTAAGLPQDVSFRLQQQSDGSLKVVGSDEAQTATIQNIFDNNPALTRQYANIQGLADLESARKSLSVSPTEMKKRIQIESIAAWWQNSDTSANSLGVFSGGGLSTYAGLNVTA